MSRALRLVILAATGLLGALSTSFVMALRQRPHPTPRQIRALLFDNWGLYSNFQLAMGLLLAATWILCVHRRKWVAGVVGRGAGIGWPYGDAGLYPVAGTFGAHGRRSVHAQPADESTEFAVPETPDAATDGALAAVEPMEPAQSPEMIESTEPVIHACNAVFNVELPEPVAHEADDVQPAPVDEPA